ncbi:hypothetical protein BC936DRAFT_138917 [Jimgerdemannia flammicorona]|uniref:HD/PDEase domain-containing protein n=1 Tax=Jimgerdemannia flammicorona TaxID=994334 RepID=A0A433BDV2_9FUNG|nr:hypothetical protein BC936DRAFT_138917 [Jimgerdemannia flammicorona]
MSGYKLINDPIHGHIRLDDFCIEVIDTAQFQRLRDLKQNGSAYFVFPGASHNRFEHSIGVSYLAGTLIERFQREQPDLEITESEVKCVKLAGLCHDLVHAASEVRRALLVIGLSPLNGASILAVDLSLGINDVRPELAWTHEKASEMMLEYLVDDNNIDLERDEVELIKSLIDGKPSSECRHSQRSFLFDIVANKRNSVDVDKFDYIERDCYNLGIKSSYDTSRLMSMSRVVDNQICFHHKEVYNIYDMFHTSILSSEHAILHPLSHMHTHEIGKAIEYMITDALLAADPHLDISDAVLRGDEYVNLTDDILRVIECSRGDELAPARAIIKRIRTRQLYKFVDEVLIPQEMKLHFTKDNINPREIIAYQDDNDQLGEHDVIIEWLRINYAMKDRNPVDMIRFYSKFNENGWLWHACLVIP